MFDVGLNKFGKLVKDVRHFLNYKITQLPDCLVTSCLIIYKCTLVVIVYEYAFTFTCFGLNYF